MSVRSPWNRAALRAVVIIALSLLMIGIFATDLRRLWQPLGVFGYSTNGDGIVLFVDDNSPAAKAGIRTGDRVDESATPPRFRTYVVQSTFVWAAGDTAALGLVHNGIHRSVTLTAVPDERDNGFRKAFRVVEFAAAVLFVLIGAALVLLRPGLTTWGFYLYCIAFAPGTWVSVWALPFPGALIADLFFYSIQVAGLIGLLVFSLCFLSQSVSGWRLSALRLTPWLFVALLTLWLFTFYQDYWVGGPPGDLLFRVTLGLIAVLSLLALYAFVDTYVRARGNDRQRMRWVIVGFATSLSAFLVYWVLVFYANTVSFWVLHPLFLTSVLVPLTIGYAVIKHRVIDVSFVVNRALVYAVLTTLLVGAFALIDWIFIDKLRLARLGTIAEMGVAVAGGFWFNGLHRRVDSLIDATFFRQRHKAEQQLARNAAALPLSPSASAVAYFLVSEPVRAMSLASAALFRRGLSGVYRREESIGWAAADLAQLDTIDEPVLTLAGAVNEPLSLDDHPWREDGVPVGPGCPSLALPILVRRELVAIVFYGSHTHGEGLDPDEIRALASLALGAAAAYDHLEAQVLKKEVEALRLQLAEMQIQPA